MRDHFIIIILILLFRSRSKVSGLIATACGDNVVRIFREVCIITIDVYTINL